MPHYYLHLHNVHIDADDRQGHDLPDIAAAQALAVAGIRGFLSHEVAQGRLDLRGQIDITDDDGGIIETVHFADVIEITSSQ